MGAYVEAALLGVVQGLTEFLPISSSAHLILARALFGWDAERFGLPFDVACHVGTLLAVVVYFRADLIRMLLAAPGLLTMPRDPGAHLGRLIVIGTVPIVIVGLALRPYEDGIRTPAVAATMLLVGGIVLLVADRVARRTREAETLRPGEAFGIGWAQSAALVPGVSRSGATITLGLLFGLKRDAAARFGFLLGVPAIAAAAILEAAHLVREPFDGETARLFLIGTVVSGLVGYATIKYFLRYLAHHSLAVFAWYRMGAAALLGLWLLT